jgi:hypothetical protein
MAFIRCPACGRWALLRAFIRGANPGHTHEMGQPQGAGRPWQRQPLPARERSALAKLLRLAADRLEGQTHEGKDGVEARRR